MCGENSPRNYIDNMRNDGEWGELPVIMAFSKMKKKKIVVWMLDSRGGYKALAMIGAVDYDCCYHLLLANHNHYQTLLPRNSVALDFLLQSLLFQNNLFRDNEL